MCINQTFITHPVKYSMMKLMLKFSFFVFLLLIYQFLLDLSISLLACRRRWTIRYISMENTEPVLQEQAVIVATDQTLFTPEFLRRRSFNGGKNLYCLLGNDTLQPQEGLSAFIRNLLASIQCTRAYCKRYVFIFQKNMKGCEYAFNNCRNFLFLPHYMPLPHKK